MKDDERARGFSFHLSASAPPAEVDERAPDSGPSWFSPGTEQLDLDLEAFAASAPAPEVASPAAPVARASVNAASAALASSPAISTPREAARPAPPASVLEAPGPLSAPAPKITADDVTRTPAPVDATSPPPPTTHAPRAAAPAVRRIQFPKGGAKPRATEVRRSETVFSTSLSQAPRARLESNDDPELEANADGALPPEDLPELAAPKSLPRGSASASSSAPRTPSRVAKADVAKTNSANAVASASSPWAELARKGALLGRQSTEQGTRLAKDASERARQLWLSGRERALSALAARREGRKSSPVEGAEHRAPEASEVAETPSARPAPKPSSDAADRTSRALADRRGPWASGGAALVAGSLAYLGASHLFADKAPAEAANAARANTVQMAESEPEADAAPAAPALAKAVPADNAAPGDAEAQSPSPDSDDEEVAPPPSKKPSTAAGTPAAVETLAMPDGMSWPGKGLIEVVTEGRELVYVDGVFTGRGPLRRIPIQPGSHEVVVRTEGQERAVRLDVTTGKRARAVFGS